MKTERVLLDAARRMEKQALVKIFDLYSSALYRYAARLCGDPVLADDVVGDVFARLLDQLDSGHGPKDNLRSYLYQTTYHRVIDEARYTRSRVPLEATDWLYQDPNSPFLGLEDQLLLQQVLHVMRRALSDDQRHVMILRFLEGFNVRQTATILGKRADHIKVIQNRAIVALRRFFVSEPTLKGVSLPHVEAVQDGSLQTASAAPEES